MSSSDISRLLIQPRKHYTGTRWQQGRVFIDSDFNEQVLLDSEDQRQWLRDVIGPTGSPDDGFAVALTVGDEVIPQGVSFNGAAAVDVLPYRLKPGALYIDGLRFTQEERDIGGVVEGEILPFQREFLQIGEADAPGARDGEVHTQLVYVHAWEQDVTPTEDEEFRERALGGIDTSTRIRRMARVSVAEVDTGMDCHAAWDTVRAQIESATGGTFDARGIQLTSSARLQINYEPGGALDGCSPCAPDDPGRYLGAQNQAIRIMMAAPDRYVWALNNASPIYRVRVGAEEDGEVPIEMLTVPRDEAHWPLRNTVVEFLPWGVLLDNGQKIADEPGVFVRADTGYDPDTKSFVLTAADAGALQALTRVWDAAHPDQPNLPNDNDPDGDYLFVRFWHRLDDDADPVLLDVNGTHDLLLRLGLRPTFTGTGNPGDYWVVTVRPNTPHVVVPWDLETPGGVGPHGPRHVYAPLSLVTFRPPEPGESSNAEVVQSIEDCRLRFRPLVDRDGCCTHTVGDGVTSFGDYTSIQEAINNLPEGGGRVCILPGTYTEEVVIDTNNVAIEGCGAQTRILTPPGENPAKALFQINAAFISIKDLELATSGQIGIRVGDPDQTSAPAESTDADGNTVVTFPSVAGIELEGLRIDADQREGLDGHTRSGIDVRGGNGVLIRDCHLTMDGSVSDDSMIFVSGQTIVVEGCRMESMPEESETAAWGGLQVGGGTKGIRIERNEIMGGVGIGITLGSLIWVSETTTSTTFGAGTGLQDTQDPCEPNSVTVRPIEVENVRYDPTTAGDIEDISIIDNRIENMSSNGISVLTMLPLADEGTTDLITTDRIRIERNRIRNNVDQSSSLRSNSPAPKAKKLEPGEEEAFGKFTVAEIPPAAIVLVDGEKIEIRDNEICDNGTGDPEPICGISVIYGDGIVIEGNRIKNNGLRQSASMPSGDPTRAGIFVSLAGVASNQPDQDQSDPLGNSLSVIGNIVDHPNGPALVARATGPVVVQANHLTSQGSNATAHESGQAHVVSITNAGVSWEALGLGEGEPSEERWIMPNRTREYLRREETPNGAEERIGHGGRVLFANNHVLLQWEEPAGVASGLAAGFSVGICTQDDVICNANQFALNVEDPGIKKAKGGDPERPRIPRISAHVVVVGATANVSHNRVSEGVNDALISILTLGGLLASMTGNTTTHMNFAATCNSFQPNTTQPPLNMPNERIDRDNLVWLVPREETSTSEFVSVATATGTANQLFAAFCNSCLGLDIQSDPTFTVSSMFTIGRTDG